MPDDFTVHDVTISEVPTITAGGGVKRVTIVRYFVGLHGPFQVQLEAGQATADNIRAAIDRQVANLRAATIGY